MATNKSVNVLMFVRTPLPAIGTECSDGFNRVQTEQSHQAFPKIHQKVALLFKKLLYFFIVVPGPLFWSLLKF